MFILTANLFKFYGWYERSAFVILGLYHVVIGFKMVYYWGNYLFFCECK